MVDAQDCGLPAGPVRQYSDSLLGPGGSTLYYRCDDFTDPWTSATVIILAHGHPRNSNLWYEWVPPLSRHFRVVRPDLRGLGLSRIPIERYENSADALVLDAIALIDHLRQEKVVWVGEATGGLLGILLAVRAPERLHSLVVINAPLKVAEARIYEHTKDLEPGEAIQGQPMIDYLLTKGMRAWSRVTVKTRPWLKEAPSGYVEWYADQIAQNDPYLAAEFYRPMPQVDLLVS